MIEDLIIITSPLRHYLKLDWQQLIGFFGVDPKYLKYQQEGPTNHVLLAFTPECERDLHSRAKELNMTLRFQSEYWPRLEESSWQRMNRISEVLR